MTSQNPSRSDRSRWLPDLAVPDTARGQEHPDLRRGKPYWWRPSQPPGLPRRWRFGHRSSMPDGHRGWAPEDNLGGKGGT